MELILVRHPRPMGAAGLCYGSSDLPVAPGDLAQAAAALRSMKLPGDSPVFSSPLHRCADLARQLCPQPVFDADLAEMNFGTWEMRHWEDIARAEVDAWADDLLHYRPGGGENVLAVARRIVRALDRIRLTNGDSALVICHAGAMRLLAPLAAGVPLEEAALAAASAPHRIGYGDTLRLTVATPA